MAKSKLRDWTKYRSWIEQNPNAILHNRAQGSAKKRGILFDLKRTDINIPTHCPLLGIPLTMTQGQGRCWTNASLDRIDNTKGYTKDNVQVVSSLANVMKSMATKEQLITFAHNILRMHNAN